MELLHPESDKLEFILTIRSRWEGLSLYQALQYDK
jgi:hypothetical protein